MPHIKAFTAAPLPQVNTRPALRRSSSSGMEFPIPGCIRSLPGAVQPRGMPPAPIPRWRRTTVSPSWRHGCNSTPSESHRCADPTSKQPDRLCQFFAIVYQCRPANSLPQVAFSATRTGHPDASNALAAASPCPIRFHVTNTSPAAGVSVSPVRTSAPTASKPAWNILDRSSDRCRRLSQARIERRHRVAVQATARSAIQYLDAAGLVTGELQFENLLPFRAGVLQPFRMRSEVMRSVHVATQQQNSRRSHRNRHTNR